MGRANPHAEIPGLWIEPDPPLADDPGPALVWLKQRGKVRRVGLELRIGHYEAALRSASPPAQVALELEHEQVLQLGRCAAPIDDIDDHKVILIVAGIATDHDAIRNEAHVESGRFLEPPPDLQPERQRCNDSRISSRHRLQRRCPSWLGHVRAADASSVSAARKITSLQFSPGPRMALRRLTTAWSSHT